MARLLRDAHGATAVEFGLVALPFFALLGGVVQVAFMIWAQQNLDFVFQKTIRTVFTGQFQQSTPQSSNPSVILAALQNNMCGSGPFPLSTVFKCSDVKFDIKVVQKFASNMPTYPIDPSTKNWSANFGTGYTCAPPGSIMIATAAVKFPVFFGSLLAVFGNFADGSKLLEATAVFRTEPYASPSQSPC